MLMCALARVNTSLGRGCNTSYQLIKHRPTDDILKTVQHTGDESRALGELTLDTVSQAEYPVTETEWWPDLGIINQNLWH